MLNVDELPRYRCHKEVRALKIKAILDDSTSAFSRAEVFEFGDDLYLDGDFMAKHAPQPGGYIVFYADGYRSYSPAQAFEAGYTRIEESK